MTDVLIRDVGEDTLRRIDADAERLGLSRNEYLRRAVERLSLATTQKTTIDDLERFADRFSDLDDEKVMGSAWSRPGHG